MHDEQRVAVVTGAARGLGAVIATTLAAEGYHLVLADLGDVSPTGRAVESLGARAVAARTDVSSEAEVSALARLVETELGGADVLVNNAGISLIEPALSTATADWQRVLDVNLTGPFLCCRAFGAAMVRAGSGAIVNVASIAGLRGISHRVAYCSSKHGLVGLTMTLAAEWGGRGVRVNAVCPGWIKTEMDVEDQSSGAYSDADITGQIPMARFAQPGDVAAAVSFLADPARSGFVNGVALSVDGGWAADGSWASLRSRTRGGGSPAGSRRRSHD